MLIFWDKFSSIPDGLQICQNVSTHSAKNGIWLEADADLLLEYFLRLCFSSWVTTPVRWNSDLWDV